MRGKCRTLSERRQGERRSPLYLGPKMRAIHHLCTFLSRREAEVSCWNERMRERAILFLGGSAGFGCACGRLSPQPTTGRQSLTERSLLITAVHPPSPGISSTSSSSHCYSRSHPPKDSFHQRQQDPCATRTAADRRDPRIPRPAPPSVSATTLSSRIECSSSLPRPPISAFV